MLSCFHACTLWTDNISRANTYISHKFTYIFILFIIVIRLLESALFAAWIMIARAISFFFLSTKRHSRWPVPDVIKRYFRRRPRGRIASRFLSVLLQISFPSVSSVTRILLAGRGFSFQCGSSANRENCGLQEKGRGRLAQVGKVYRVEKLGGWKRKPARYTTRNQYSQTKKRSRRSPSRVHDGMWRDVAAYICERHAEYPDGRA